ncbi:MAG TPA: urease accessory protein UreD [Pseudolabrys sp.]|nr:urease accessory protein UreD [Pseudolabrys sp.]
MRYPELQHRSSPPAIPTARDALAPNRAIGRIALTVGANGNRTRRLAVHEAGSLRVRFPNASTDLLEAVLINTAGGMTGGDDFSVKMSLGSGAQLVASTAAAEKIYRSIGDDATITVAIDASAGSRCIWLPRETILFDRARLSRRIDVDLAANASLVMAEAVVFGRAAMKEAVHEGCLIDRWRVSQDGRLRFAESVRLEGSIARKLAVPPIACGAVAIATVLAIPGDENMVTAARSLDFTGELGISSWNGMTVARLCAPTGAALLHDLAVLLPALQVQLPRLWLQ